MIQFSEQKASPKQFVVSTLLMNFSQLLTDLGDKSAVISNGRR